MSPDFVGNYLVFTVAHGFVPVNRNLASDRFDDALQRFANVGVAVRFHRGGVHLIEEAVIHLLHHDLSLTRRTLLRFVAKVDPKRSKKNEGQDDSDHYVVVDATARIRPPDVAFDGLGELAHRSVQFTLFGLFLVIPTEPLQPRVEGSVVGWGKSNRRSLDSD